MAKVFRYKNRNRTYAQWDDINEILLKGEIGYEEDTGRFKIGDGFLPWRELKYFVPSESGVDFDDLPSLALIYENAKV